MRSNECTLNRRGVLLINLQHSAHLDAIDVLILSRTIIFWKARIRGYYYCTRVFHKIFVVSSSFHDFSYRRYIESRWIVLFFDNTNRRAFILSFIRLLTVCIVYASWSMAWNGPIIQIRDSTELVLIKRYIEALCCSLNAGQAAASILNISR